MNNLLSEDCYVPLDAVITQRIQETDNVFTLRLALTDPVAAQQYRFAPGQFNMLYVLGAGEVAISIASDPDATGYLDHTIRAVGRVTHHLARLGVGEHVGVRGPYGHGWPLADAQGKDVYIVTGGLGCAPVLSVIDYILRRRDQFGRLYILQGIKHESEMVYSQRYEAWRAAPNTEVHLAADHGGAQWPWHRGFVTDLIDNVALYPDNAIVMACGPEIMMERALRRFAERGVADDRLYLSMERNMHCAVGHCGHCQFGGKFICKDGPVFAYPRVRDLLGKAGI